ncbi:hypothetical protein WSM22_18180 [Cytophagales bacterium WSM2-2]|nr:hypothetical protein WSM22_18180 [Cytophagales bacterium WSM2-2]
MKASEALEKKKTKDFLEAADRYCKFLESIPTNVDFFKEIHLTLTHLYLTAIKLPEISIDTNYEPDVSISLEQQKEIIDRLFGHLGDKRYYWHTFDPYDHIDNQPVCGDLADDLLDIYKDLKRGLLKYDLPGIESKEHALWEMQFLFKNHWGAHCINAMRAVHEVVVR